MEELKVLDLNYFHRKQKAPENPLRLEADRQSAIQCGHFRGKLINRSLKARIDETVSDTTPSDIFRNGRLRTISGRMSNRRSTNHILGEMANDKRRTS